MMLYWNAFRNVTELSSDRQQQGIYYKLRNFKARSQFSWSDVKTIFLLLWKFKNLLYIAFYLKITIMGSWSTEYT